MSQRNTAWLLCLGLVLSGLSACSDKHAGHQINCAYYWRTVFSFSQTDQEYCKKHNIKQLYVRAFDVEPDPVYVGRPVGVLSWNDSFPVCCQLVPVVFINNGVFRRANHENMEVLAKLILDKIASVCHSIPYQEVQLDCDWSKETRDNYFLLLKKIRQYRPRLQLSATIRLHQFKYRTASGIPPVDRGMLMLYNVLPLRQFDSRNSILDIDELKKYLTNKDPYPVELDVVFPIFSWGVVFRNAEFRFLLHDLDTDEAAHLSFLQKEQELYRVNVDTVWHNVYLRYGDEIRIEECSPALLETAVKLARRTITPHPKRWALFDFDEKNMQRYEEAFLDRLFENTQ